MAQQIKVFYDQKGHTLTVWFGEPKQEYVCQETAEEFVLMKDKAGHVLGFEKLNFEVDKPDELGVAFKSITQ